MKVTLLQLKLQGACLLDRRKFKRTFGYSAEVTPENMKKAVDVGLDVLFYIKVLRNHSVFAISDKKTERLIRLYSEYRNARLLGRTWANDPLDY